MGGVLRRLHAPIRHRGPDDERVVELTPQVGMAFRRLKIIDLSDDAAQPMVSHDGRYAILFNGEIYNFRELRGELVSRGHRFRTSGDTEVLLAAFAEWDTGAFAKLEGMWAIVIVDLQRKRIVACRDRFGIKPLHWAWRDGALLFASEARQILAATGTAPRANASRVALHLGGSRYPVTDETFFDDVESVPPASYCEVPFDAKPPLTFTPYWRLADVHVDRSLTYADALERFDAALVKAVRSHHVADVEIGSLLSGGLDSSTIAAMLAADDPRIPTYSFGFREPAYAKFSELPYVDAIVRENGLRNHQTSFDAAWVRDHLGIVTTAIEEPPMALPVLAQYRVFELARQHGTTVVLDGQGADEILGGYSYYQRLLLVEALRRKQPARFAHELRAIAKHERRASLSVLNEFFFTPVGRRVFGRKSSMLDRDYAADRSRLEAVRADAAGDSMVNRRLYFDVRWGNVKIILGYADRNSMQHSIEARVPFFDRALVELAFSMPAEFKAGEGQRKRVLRDVARRRIPRAITERTDRMGFGTPDALLMEGALRPMLRDALADPALDRVPFLRPGVANEVRREVEAGRYRDPRATFRLFTLMIWAHAFGVRW